MKIKAFFLLLMSLYMIACGGGSGAGEIPTTPWGTSSLHLTLSKSIIKAESNGVATSFNVTSNVTWSVSNPADWMEVSPESGVNNGVVSVTIKENKKAKKREATITVSGGGVSKSIEVTQEEASVILTVSPENLTINAEAGHKDITITSNSEWTAESTESWCSLNVSKGEENAMLGLDFEANPTSNERSANVIITALNVKKAIKITQERGVIIPSENDNGTPVTPSRKSR